MFNFNWCRNICHEGNDDGTISGKVKNFTAEESVSLTTYFYNALFINKTIDPNKIAVNCYDRVLTFGELDNFSSSIAQQLKSKIGSEILNDNPDKELVIAVCLPQSEKLITVIFAILKTGAAYLPLDPIYPESVISIILKKFRPLVLIGDENDPIFTKFNPDSFPEGCIVLSVEDLWLSMNVSGTSVKKKAGMTLVEPLVSPAHPDIPPFLRPAVVLQTTDISGTEPRGVRLSHMSIMNGLIWCWRELPFSRNGSCCLTVPVNTVYSINQIFGPLLKGVNIHIFSKKDTRDMNTCIRRMGSHHITRIHLIPVILRDFLNECWSIGPREVHSMLSALNHVICQGDIMPLSLALLFFTVFPSHKTLSYTFGATEMAGDIIGETYRSEHDLELKSFQKRLTFGRCLDNSRICIIGAGAEVQTEWNQGEICVSGCPVALGYVNMSAYNIEHAFIDNPLKNAEGYHKTLYRTGVYGRMVRCRDERLRLYIEGRADEIILQQGYEFNMDDVRSIVSKLSCVRFLETVIFHQGKMDQTLVAFIVTRSKGAHEKDSKSNSIVTLPDTESSTNTYAGAAGEIDFQLRSKLPDFMIPEIKILTSLPFIHNTGRIDQAELLYAYQFDREPGEEDWHNLKVQSSEMYDAAKVLFRGMFKFCSSSVATCIANMDVSCFDLGVTSLNVVCLSSYISLKGYEIHLREMLVTQTVSDLINLMVNRKAMAAKGRRKSSSLAVLSMEVKEEFTVKLLDHLRSKDAFKLVAKAYTEKGDLESYNVVRPHEYLDFLSYYYNAYKEQSICFYVTQKPYDEIVSVCMAHDYFTDFNIKLNASLQYIIDIQQEIKGLNLGKFPHKRNRILELFIMATHEKMSSSENVQLVLLMLGELTNFAEKEGYTHIYVNSTNQLMRDLCTSVLGYTIIDDFPIRDFIQKDGFRPYRLAPCVLCMTSLCCRLVTDINNPHHHRLLGGSIMKGKYLKIPTNVSVTDYFSRRLNSGEIRGETTALIHDGIDGYTFDQLEDKSTRLAKALKTELDLLEWNCNNEDGDLVIAFCLGNTEVMIITLFAIVKLGATYMPLDPLTPEEHLVRIVAGTRPILIITESHDPIVSRFESVAHVVNIIKINALLEKAKYVLSDLNDVQLLESERRSWERTAAIYHTSGTSGRRRGVRIGHTSILNRCIWQWDAIPYEEDDISCLLTQTTIHTSIPDIFGPLLHGTPLVILNRATIPKADFLISRIVHHGVTRVTLSSSVLTSIVYEYEIAGLDQETKSKLSAVRCWFCCGDMLTKDLCHRFFESLGKFPEGEDREVDGKRIPRLVHVYGTTETTADATFEVFNNSNDVDEKCMDYQAPLGTPIANTAIYISGETQNILPLDTIGQICVSGKCLGHSYILSDVCGKFLPNKFSKSKDFSRIFRTGDLGRITEDSDDIRRLYHEGRCGSIVKAGGKQVDLNTISKAVRATSLVDDVEVFVFHPDREDQVIVAATILKHDVIASDVTHDILDKVDKYCVPEIFPQSNFPVQSDGRVDRHKLVHVYKASRDILANSIDWNVLNLTGQEMEAGKSLCEVVAISIGVSIPFIITNFQGSFWNLGGTSDNVILAVSRLRAKDYHITLEDFIYTEFLPAIVNLMVESHGKHKPDLGIQYCEKTKEKYVILPMHDSHKEKVLRVLCTAYAERGTFALYTDTTYEDFHEFLSEYWKEFLKHNLSIVVESKETNEIVAVSINLDANAKPAFKKIPKSMKYAMDLFQRCEQNSKGRLTNSKRKLIEPFMMGTKGRTSAGENTLLELLMLKDTMEKGLQRSFTHIFIVSDSAIIRQMCRNVLKCEVQLEFPISSYVASDNTKPFNYAGVGSYSSVVVYSKGLTNIIR